MWINQDAEDVEGFCVYSGFHLDGKGRRCRVRRLRAAPLCAYLACRLPWIHPVLPGKCARVRRRTPLSRLLEQGAVLLAGFHGVDDEFVAGVEGQDDDL